MAGFSIIGNHFLDQGWTAQEIAVYIALVRFANDDGECWPSHRALAKVAGTSERTVQRALASLREKGAVTWRHRRDADGDLTSNLYSVAAWRRGGVVTQGHHLASEGHHGGDSVAEEQDPLNKKDRPTRPDRACYNCGVNTNYCNCEDPR